MDHRHRQERYGPRKGKSPATSVATPPSEPPRACPRCGSTNTKFCYYNNYSSAQPRYFCRACRRYWTQGGAIRNPSHGSAATRRSAKLPKRTAPAAPASASASLPPLQLQVGPSEAAPPPPPPWCFPGAGLLRPPAGWFDRPTMLPEVERPLSPGLGLGPPAPEAAPVAAEEGRLFSAVLYRGVGDGGGVVGRRPPSSSGPLV